MTTTEAPPIKTRRPTGKPPWPMILLAGAEKSGKSYSAAAFSASDLIDRTFWIEIGEGAADQYGALPGARYEIVEHDGTYRSIGRAIRAATMQPRTDGRPHAIVVDSMTELWDLLSDEAQAAANRRKKLDDDGEAQITMDLWNIAKKRWRAIIDLLRVYDGPVILTSRLEQVAVMDAGGKPTTAKTLKVRSEKNLPYEVDAIVQIPAPRQYQLTGVRSVRWTMKPGGHMDVPDFTVDGLLRQLGLDEVGATQARSFTAPRQEYPAPQDQVAEAVARKAQRERRAEPPQDDPWAAGDGDGADWHSDAETARTDSEPRPSTEKQRKALVLLIQRKRGVSAADRGGQRAIVSGLLGRPVPSFTDLSFGEAHRLLDKFDGMPDAELTPEADASAPAPNPRNGDGPPLSPQAQEAYTEAYAATETPQQQAQGADGSWSHQRLADRGTPLPPPGWTREQGDQLAADFLTELNSASTDKERTDIAVRIASAVKAAKISPEDRTTLLDTYNGRQPKRGRAKANA